jgi:hypothetical protein
LNQQREFHTRRAQSRKEGEAYHGQTHSYRPQLDRPARRIDTMFCFSYLKIRRLVGQRKENPQLPKKWGLIISLQQR